MVVAAVRRIVFKPARYAVPAKYGKGHTVDAIFLLALIAHPDGDREPLRGQQSRVSDAARPASRISGRPVAAVDA